MKTAAAILSFVCSFTFFQSCYGIKCYSCNSNVTETECNNIVDDQFLIDCPEGDSCGYITKKTKDGQAKVSRTCLSDDLLKTFNKEVKILEKAGLQVDFVQICNTDKCNGKFQLDSVSP